MDQEERQRRKGVIGIGAICPLCDRVIRSGECYLSGWGESRMETVHLLCNNRRLNLDGSHPIGTQIHNVLRETIHEVKR